MDGRDLFIDICPDWNKNYKIVDIANKLPKFINKVVLSKVYNFYGTFHIGAIYDLKNFSNMLVSKYFYIYIYIYTIHIHIQQMTFYAN